jgi:hypothetical protein
MKAEHAQARADRKAKIQQGIDQLNAKLQGQLQKAKEQRQAAERDAQLKVEALKAKAKAAACEGGRIEDRNFAGTRGGRVLLGLPSSNVLSCE